MIPPRPHALPPKMHHRVRFSAFDQKPLYTSAYFASPKTVGEVYVQADHPVTVYIVDTEELNKIIQRKSFKPYAKSANQYIHYVQFPAIYETWYLLIVNESSVDTVNFTYEFNTREVWT